MKKLIERGENMEKEKGEYLDNEFDEEVLKPIFETRYDELGNSGIEPIKETEFETREPEDIVMDELKLIQGIDKKYDELGKEIQKLNDRIDKLIETLYDVKQIAKFELDKLY